jgi:hypothetical protein
MLEMKTWGVVMTVVFSWILMESTIYVHPQQPRRWSVVDVYGDRPSCHDARSKRIQFLRTKKGGRFDLVVGAQKIGPASSQTLRGSGYRKLVTFYCFYSDADPTPRK